MLHISHSVVVKPGMLSPQSMEEIGGIPRCRWFRSTETRQTLFQTPMQSLVAILTHQHSIFPPGRTTKSTALTTRALAVLMAARHPLDTTATILESGGELPAIMRYHTFPHHHPPRLVALSPSSEDRQYHTAMLYTSSLRL